MRREAVAETWLPRARGWTLPNCDGAHSFQPRRPARASAREEGGEAQLRERARGALPSATVRGEGCRAAGARRAARAASASAARQEASNSTYCSYAKRVRGKVSTGQQRTLRAFVSVSGRAVDFE